MATSTLPMTVLTLAGFAYDFWQSECCEGVEYGGRPLLVGADTKRADNVRIWCQSGLVTA